MLSGVQQDFEGGGSAYESPLPLDALQGIQTVGVFYRLIDERGYAVRHQPVGVSLSATTIAENTSVGTTVGDFITADQDVGDAFTYALVAGEGDTDNDAFEIVGAELRTKTTFDYESRQSYSVRVQSTDRAGLWVEERVAISVTNVNEAPTAVAISNSVISSFPRPGLTVADLRTTDPDAADTFTYQFVAGSGSDDNSAFTLVNGVLSTNEPVDYAAKSSYAIRVRATDASGLWVEEVFTIEVQPPQVGDAYIFFDIGTGEFRLNPGNAAATGGSYMNPAQVPLSWGINSFGVEMDPAIGMLSTDMHKYFFPSGTWPLFFPQTGANPGNAFGSAFQTWSLPNVRTAGGAAGPSNDSLNKDNLVIGSPWIIQTGPSTGACPGESDCFTVPGSTAVFASTIPGYEGYPEFSFGSFGPRNLTEQEALASLGVSAQGNYATGNRVYSMQNVGRTQFFRIYVGNSLANASPTNIRLATATATVEENLSPGALVGTFSTIDTDVRDTFTYALVAGEGDTDNMFFQLSGDELRTAAAFDFEARDSYSIRVRTTDPGGLFVEQDFAITVTDIVEDWSLEQGPGERILDSERRSGSSRLVKRGPGVLILDQANDHAGGTVVEAGELVIRNPEAIGSGTLQVLPGARLTLDVGSRRVSITRLELSQDAEVDLRSGSILLGAGSYDLAAVRSMIIAGRDNGRWSGPGLRSSIIQPGSFREVGYHLMPDGALAVGFAAVGDANMDGLVNVLDLISLSAAGKIGGAGFNSHWWEGDFNFDGFANVNDLIAVLSSGLYRGPSYLPVDRSGTAAMQAPGGPSLNAVSTGVTLTGYAFPEVQPEAVPTVATAAQPARTPEARRAEQFAWAAIASQSETEAPKFRRVSGWGFVGR